MRLNWKTSTPTLAAILIGAFVVAASQGGGDQNNSEAVRAHLNWLTQQLGLTRDQQTKLMPILTEEREQMRVVRQDTSLKRDQEQNKLKEVHETFKPKINAILTPTQQETYKRLEKEALERHKGKAKHRTLDSEPK